MKLYPHKTLFEINMRVIALGRRQPSGSTFEQGQAFNIENVALVNKNGYEVWRRCLTMRRRSSNRYGRRSRSMTE